MAAGTATRAAANKSSLYELWKRVKRALSAQHANPDGLFVAFDSGSVTPAATETETTGDRINILQFPNGFKLVDFQIVSTADVDTGTGTWAYDVTSFDGDSTDVVLISGCTVGATASGKDEMDRNGGLMFYDVGGDYLCIKTTTGSNANAGTGAIRVKGYGYMGSLPDPSA